MTSERATYLAGKRSLRPLGLRCSRLSCTPLIDPLKSLSELLRSSQRNVCDGGLLDDIRGPADLVFPAVVGAHRVCVGQDKGEHDADVGDLRVFGEELVLLKGANDGDGHVADEFEDLATAVGIITHCRVSVIEKIY